MIQNFIVYDIFLGSQITNIVNNTCYIIDNQLLNYESCIYTFNSNENTFYFYIKNQSNLDITFIVNNTSFVISDTREGLIHYVSYNGTDIDVSVYQEEVNVNDDYNIIVNKGTFTFKTGIKIPIENMDKEVNGYLYKNNNTITLVDDILENITTDNIKDINNIKEDDKNKFIFIDKDKKYNYKNISIEDLKVSRDITSITLQYDLLTEPYISLNIDYDALITIPSTSFNINTLDIFIYNTFNKYITINNNASLYLNIGNGIEYVTCYTHNNIYIKNTDSISISSISFNDNLNKLLFVEGDNIGFISSTQVFSEVGVSDLNNFANSTFNESQVIIYRDSNWINDNIHINDIQGLSLNINGFLKNIDNTLITSTQISLEDLQPNITEINNNLNLNELSEIKDLNITYGKVLVAANSSLWSIKDYKITDLLDVNIDNMVPGYYLAVNASGDNFELVEMNLAKFDKLNIDFDNAEGKYLKVVNGIVEPVSIINDTKQRFGQLEDVNYTNNNDIIYIQQNGLLNPINYKLSSLKDVNIPTVINNKYIMTDVNNQFVLSDGKYSILTEIYNSPNNTFPLKVNDLIIFKEFNFKDLLDIAPINYTLNDILIATGVSSWENVQFKFTKLKDIEPLLNKTGVFKYDQVTTSFSLEDFKLSNLEDIIGLTIKNGDILISEDNTQWNTIPFKLKSLKDVSNLSLVSGDILQIKNDTFTNINFIHDNLSDIINLSFSHNDIIIKDSNLSWTVTSYKYLSLTDIRQLSLSLNDIVIVNSGGNLSKIPFKLSELKDVSINNYTSNDIIAYQGNSTWLNIPFKFSNLSDISTLNCTSNDIIIYNGVSWSSTQFLLANQKDVNINNIQISDILKYNGASWVNTPFALSMLSDIISISLTSNVVLYYNGSYITKVPYNFNALLDIVQLSYSINDILIANSTSTWTKSKFEYGQLSDIKNLALSFNEVPIYAQDGFITKKSLNLVNLGDVSFSSYIPGAYLQVNNNSQFEQVLVTLGGVSSFKALSDNAITSYVNGTFLKVNDQSQIINASISFLNIQDANFNTSIDNGKFLKIYNGQVIAESITSTSSISSNFTDLLDVVVDTSIDNGKILIVQDGKIKATYIENASISHSYIDSNILSSFYYNRY